ncbi:hypothetical protein [Candidatus Contubernalis alkaliaceticus]|nr:hypothetical protein [Candidatus Contubernalis alkalaceticus]
MVVCSKDETFLQRFEELASMRINDLGLMSGMKKYKAQKRPYQNS